MLEPTPTDVPPERPDWNQKKLPPHARPEDKAERREEENWRGYPLHILNLILDS
jgi:hypothetical protein